MKILGLEIKRSVTAAEPTPGAGSVSIQKSNQKTEDSIPLKRAYPRAELGDSGTQMLHGIITEEYLSNLQGIRGIRVFDEMRKSDGTVRAAILVTTLPIRRAQWFVNPAIADDEQAKEIASFVEHALFDWLDISWDDVLRQALLMVPFGVMAFEKVYGTHDHEGKTYVTLEKLAPRLPKSIQQWELPDRTFGIQQVRQDGVMANIPGSKLLIFVNEREGDNWWGTSMLRAAYKHWYYKNSFYKIDAVAFERQGIGVPKITMPLGYTESDERKAITAAQNLRANESAFLILPPEYTAEFMDMGSNTTRDPATSISHHNREIVKSVLAQFLELGSTNVGSRSLSEDHSDLFLKSIEAIANTIISEINKNLIPELVDMNFDDVEAYPKLDFSGISRTDMKALADSYSTLVTAKGITPNEEDEQYLRSTLGLPARKQEDIEDPSAEDQEDGKDIETTPDNTEAGDKEVDNATEDISKKKPTEDDKKVTDTKIKKAHEHVNLVRKFEIVRGFQSWRELTFAEKKVDWVELQSIMDEMQAEFSKDAQEALMAAKTAFMTKLQAAYEANDTKAITDLEVKFILEYKLLVKDALKKAYVYGKAKAAAEMGIVPPANAAASMQQIDLLADTIANKLASDIETKAKISAVNGLKTDVSTLQVMGAIDLALEEAIKKGVDSAASIIIGQGINTGRNDVFYRNKDKIHGLQRSEILDEVTCNFCLSMDGLIVDSDDKWAQSDIFHSNCRGIWVQIMKDEQDAPDVTGIPDNLGDYYGGSPNNLIQPPRVIGK